MKIRINGKEYDWGTIKIIMWGRPVVGATSVDYKRDHRHEPRRP